jgi:hypothetical protein
MKKLFLLFVLISFSKIYSQNLQIHYDFGEDRKYITSTLEMFKPDEYGATFFFVDFDYSFPGNNSMSLAYFEIARYVNIYKKLSLTIQYNDGIVVTEGTPLNNAFTLNQTWLGGVSYPIDLGFVTLNTDLLFRKTYGSDAPDGQLTVVWFVPFMNNKITFTGFLDVWSQDKLVRAQLPSEGDKEVVFLTEPQLWYNLTNHLAVGTEFEISNNFLPFQDKIEVNPTLALKWNF